MVRKDRSDLQTRTQAALQKVRDDLSLTSARLFYCDKHFICQFHKWESHRKEHYRVFQDESLRIKESWNKFLASAKKRLTEDLGQ